MSKDNKCIPFLVCGIQGYLYCSTDEVRFYEISTGPIYDMKTGEMSEKSNIVVVSTKPYKIRILSEEDCEKIKSLVMSDLKKIRKPGEDLTREPECIVMDGSYTYFDMDTQGRKKHISCSNLWIYENDEGLSPDADKLLRFIGEMNSILKKYRIKIKYNL